jgi:DNA adenine methylase
VTVLAGYPGRKGASGVRERILSLMPRHERYIEPFLGSGAILAAKRPARSTIAADADGDVVAAHEAAPLPGVEYMRSDAFMLLPSLELTRADLVYLDPPYHPATRTKQKLYRHELDHDDHRRLLSLCLTLKASVMLSGYRCPLYDAMLYGWHREDFTAMTRGGPRVESVWCNFTPGLTFHDTRFLGGNYRERERIKRKRQRWTARLQSMGAAERAVIWEALELTTLELARAADRGADHIAAAIDGASDIGDRGVTAGAGA